MRSRLLAAAAILAALAASGRADDTPAPKGRMVTKVFSVADLVTPIPDFAVPATVPPVTAPKLPTVAENADNLIKLITSTVRPTSWETSGGHGTIEFFELGTALVVTQSEDVLKETETLLAALSRHQDMAIACEVCLVTVPVDSLAACRVKTPTKEGEVTFLTGDQLKDLMTADQGGSILQSPKITLANGQTGTVCSVGQTLYTTGLDVRLVNGSPSIVPKNETVDDGVKLTLKGRIAADGKTIALGINLTHSQIGACQQIPVTTMITPVFEGGSQGVPIPFTQFIQNPTVNTCKVDKQLVLPSGGHAVIAGPVETRESREEFRVPVLSDIPFVGDRLFTSIGITNVKVRTLVVVSPVVISSDEPTTSEPAPAQCPRQVGQTPDLAVPLTQAVPVPVPVTRLVRQTPDLAVPLTQPTPCSPRMVAPPPVAVFQGGVVQVTGYPNALMTPPPYATCPTPIPAPRAVAQVPVATTQKGGQILIPTLMIQVPAGFLEKAGVTSGKNESVCLLTDREARMLTTAIQAEPEREILSRPTLQLQDQQTGYTQVGQQYPYLNSTGLVLYRDLGVTMHATPKVLPDDSISLRAELCFAWVGSNQKAVPNDGEPAQSGLVIQESSIRTETKVPSGSTVLYRMPSGDRETIVIMTVHRVRISPPVDEAGRPAPTVPAPSSR